MWISIAAAFSTALSARRFIRLAAEEPDIRNGKRIHRKFETEFKRQVVAQIEAGELTVREAAREHQLAHSLIEYWCKQYRSDKLVDCPSKRERQLEAENEKLKAKVGDLVMQMDYLKKLQDWVQRKRNVDTFVITAKNLDQYRKPAK